MAGILTTIGKNLRTFRKRIGISQEQLAELAELHRTYIGAVERGEKNISAKNIEKIASVLGIEPHRLLGPKQFSTSESMKNDTEQKACIPVPIKNAYFNTNCTLPYGLEVIHIRKAMQEFISFIGFINQQLHTKEMPRLESFLMPANFSSIVGEFMNASIPKYCSAIVKNQYHNGHPD
jgi:transcriptional regulator with XRE-family HTH domain